MSYKQTRGAISVFLVIILVPCLVFTSVFVDLGRSHMSKAMAEASSDLALNTLMTNYDADLNEWYGMIASCQNISEYYDIASRYFLRSMGSQSISGEEAILVSDYAQAAFDKTKISDLLRCDVQTAPSEIINPVSGANLSNAALIKTQIIEFMKYRGPIEIARGLFGRLSGDPDNESEGGAVDTGDVDKNEPEVEKKRNFYEAEGELQAAAFYTYVAIRKYYRDWAPKLSSLHEPNGSVINNANLGAYATQLDAYRAAYDEIHTDYVKYFCNTGGLSIYSHVYLKLDDYREKDPEEAFKKDKDKLFKNDFDDGKLSDDSDGWLITGVDCHDLMDDLKEAMEDFTQARDNLANAAKELLGTMYGEDSDPNAVNAIQWWVKMNKAINASSGTNYTKKVKEAGEKMMGLYLGLYLIEESDKVEVTEPYPVYNKPPEQKTPEEKERERDVHVRAKEFIQSVEDLQKKYLGQSIGNSDDYQKAVSALEKVSNANWSKINPASCMISYNGSQVSVEQALHIISGELSSIREYFQKMVDQLNIAINGDGKNTKSMSELESLANKYHDSYNKWSDEAHKGDTQMKRDDAKALDGGYTGEEAKYNVDPVAEKITAEAVRVLKNRIVNIRDQFKKVVSAIDSMKYGSAKMAELSTVDEMRKKVGSAVSGDYLAQHWLNGEINDYAETTFQNIVQPKGDHVLSLEHLSDNNWNPDIDPSPSNSVNTPELYVYFHSQWATVKDENLDEVMQEKDEAMDEAKKQSEAVIEELAGSDTDRVNIKRDFSHGNSTAVAVSLIKALGGSLKALFTGEFDDLRDHILMTTYLRNMFTFATYENEGKWNLLSSETRKKVGLMTYSAEYEKVVGAADQDGTWLSENTEDRYNKSLTNKLMNRANNAAYQAELEYILYGKDSCSKNVACAYGEIYALRVIVNTISAFQHFWTPKNTMGGVVETVADLLASACLGILPPPFWKCVLLVILGLAESAMDLKRLSCGFPVELYKSKAEQWYLAVPDASGLKAFVKSLAGGGDAKPNGTSGIFYSDYLTLFLLLAIMGGGGLQEDIYLRTAEVIQTNMRQHEGIEESYTLKNSQVYFKLHAVVRVRPLMITLPIFSMGDFENDMDTKTDWCTYTIDTVRGYS